MPDVRSDREPPVDRSSVFFPKGGTSVQVYGSLFSSLAWRGSHIEEGDPIPFHLQRQVRQLLFTRLLQKKDMELKEVHLRRLGRGRGSSLVFQLQNTYTCSKSKSGGLMTANSVFKYGRRSRTGRTLSEEARWRQYVVPWLDLEQIALLEGLETTHNLKGALYRYVGVPTGDATGYAPTLVDLIHLETAFGGKFWGEAYSAIFKEIAHVLLPWQPSFSLDRVDMAEHIRSICQPRILQIREFIESVGGGERIRIQDEGKEFIFMNPLVILDEKLVHMGRNPLVIKHRW